MTQGTRRDYDDDSIPAAGEYGKMRDGTWYGVPPEEPEMIANLSGHSILEHEDGTITVSPSILVSQAWRNREWHGFLEGGVWRKV